MELKELFILRHGIAEDSSATGADRDRVLTAEGKKKTREAARAFAKLEISFDIVLSSPFARAWQTAEIVVNELGCPKLLQECLPLESGGSTKAVLSELAKTFKSNSSVLVVGHEPDLSRLISVLLSGHQDLAIAMKKGGLARLSCSGAEPGKAQLEWLLAPKHLSRLG
jgi:phosphohistidine phosphatase